jgi:hypothetical protein
MSICKIGSRLARKLNEVQDLSAKAFVEKLDTCVIVSSADSDLVLEIWSPATICKERTTTTSTANGKLLHYLHLIFFASPSNLRTFTTAYSAAICVGAPGSWKLTKSRCVPVSREWSRSLKLHPTIRTFASGSLRLGVSRGMALITI